MNKIIILLGVVVLVVLGYYFMQGSTVSYVATVDDEVAELETELAEIEAQVAAGTLTAESANLARAKIVARLDSINEALDSAESKKLTPEQRQTLIAGLDRFKDVLSKYSSTLNVVEETATEKPTITSIRGRTGGGRTIFSAVSATIDIVEEHVEEVVEDYVPEEETESSDENDDSSDTEDSEAGENEPVEESEETEDTPEDEAAEEVVDDTGETTMEEEATTTN